jgi:hypothetical protein
MKTGFGESPTAGRDPAKAQAEPYYANGEWMSLRKLQLRRPQHFGGAVLQQQPATGADELARHPLRVR